MLICGRHLIPKLEINYFCSPSLTLPTISGRSLLSSSSIYFNCSPLLYIHHSFSYNFILPQTVLFLVFLFPFFVSLKCIVRNRKCAVRILEVNKGKYKLTHKYLKQFLLWRKMSRTNLCIKKIGITSTYVYLTTLILH